MHLKKCSPLIEQVLEVSGHAPHDRLHLLWVHVSGLQPLQIQHILWTVGQLLHMGGNSQSCGKWKIHWTHLWMHTMFCITTVTDTSWMCAAIAAFVSKSRVWILSMYSSFFSHCKYAKIHTYILLKLKKIPCTYEASDTLRWYWMSVITWTAHPNNNSRSFFISSRLCSTGGRNKLLSEAGPLRFELWRTVSMQFNWTEF